MNEIGPEIEHVLAGLHGVGAGRLPDVFMFPVLGSGRRQWCHYSLTANIRWRDQCQEFYLRSVRAPFDIVPLRPTDPARLGYWYSIGPGFLEDDQSLAEQVLLVQVEQLSAEEIDAERFRQLFSTSAVRFLAEERVISNDGKRTRDCFSIIFN